MKEFLVFIVLWSISCANSVSINGRIVGGEITDISRLPYQVSFHKNGRHNCGGTIIAPNWIVTAAHCFEKTDDPKTYSIRAGSNNRSSGGQVMQIRRMIPHENYDPSNGDNDIALLELESNIAFNQNSQPIQLASNDGVDGTHCKISGWGDTKNTNNNEDLFRSADVFIVNRIVCSKILTITDNMICAGVQQGGVDSCQGDSGGPLVCNHSLMGVVSWGNGCAQPESPGVYTRISVLRNWIRSKCGI